MTAINKNTFREEPTMKKEIETKELEYVNGGTVSELDQLMRAISSDNEFVGATAHAPYVNNFEANAMVRKLRSLGIDANINLGLMGTGVLSEPNKYTDMATGESMTHMQVLSVLLAKG